jgi:CelD/BcsL family acetyltransferase involved in cellulose biosynthesis
MSTDLESRLISADLATEWATFVDGHDTATIFHTLGWLRSVEAVFDYEPQHRLVYDTARDEPIAAVPGFVVSETLGYSVVNPFCEYGFPLIDSEVSHSEVLKALIAGLDRFAARIIKEVPWSSVGEYNEAGYGAVRTGASIRLRLDRPYEDIWDTEFDRDVRRCVRMAENKGVTAEEGTIAEFYPLYHDTMRRLGSPQFPREFFRSLRDRFGEATTVLLARHDGRSIGGVLLLEWGDTTVIWTVTSDRSYWEYQPTHLLYARAIERACENGQSAVDFGRSRTGSSVHGFKSQFGGLSYPLVSFVAPPHRTSRASLEQYNRVAGIAQRLGPIITHRLVGPMLKERIHE